MFVIVSSLTWTGDPHREAHETLSHLLHISVWNFSHHTDYVSLKQNSCILPPKYYFSCFPHHATGSSSLLTQLHVQKRMPFPLLHTFLSYLYSSLKHLISVLPISLLGILYVLTNGNLISSLIILPIFCSSPYFYNIHEKPFKIQVPNQLHEFPISVAPANGQVKVLMSSTQFCSWSHFISLVYRLPL